MGQTGAQEYGLVDNLALTYSGNQLTKVTDNAAGFAYNNGFEFKDGADKEMEYTYDENGNLTQDLNRNIEDIQYNFLNLPQRIDFGDGSTTEYLYDAEGRKLRTVHRADGKTTTTDYAGNLIYENGNPSDWLRNTDMYLCPKVCTLLPAGSSGKQPRGGRSERKGGRGEPLLPLRRYVRSQRKRTALQVQRKGTRHTEGTQLVRLWGKAL
mgnify:CR=1 FL=1